MAVAVWAAQDVLVEYAGDNFGPAERGRAGTLSVLRHLTVPVAKALQLLFGVFIDLRPAQSSPNTLAKLGVDCHLFGDGSRQALRDIRMFAHQVERETAPLESLSTVNVPEWTEHSLPPVANIPDLEGAIREAVLDQGLSFATPFPFLVRGTAAELHVHVLNHSCPIANPEGPEPWRFTGTDKSTILVGFYAQDAAGVLTHHGQNSQHMQGGVLCEWTQLGEWGLVP